MRALLALIKKEFIQFLRRKPLIVLVIWTIAVEIAICAYSITYDVTHIRLAVYDSDGSPVSRELVSRFGITEYFDDAYRPASLVELDRLVEAGLATIGLIIPADFSRRIEQGLTAPVQLVLDGSNSNSALLALGYASRIVQQHSDEIQFKRAGVVAPLPAIRNQQRAWYNPTLRSLDFEIVSMLALAVMMISIILPAAGLAWEKEAGTIEQLFVMPFRVWELMLAKVVPTFFVSLASLALALWLPWWFNVPIRGSLTLFFALSAVFLFTGVGIGLFLGNIAQNLQQALLLAFFSIVPLMVISGTLMPAESMPRPVQLLSLVSPLRYYHEIGLGIFLKGVGWQILWPKALAMGALGVAIFACGIWQFGRRIG
jgi:ABC-2 type transport system permease protein